MPLWPAGARNAARIATYAVSMLSVLSSTKAQAIDDGERAKVLRPTTTFSTAERWETLSGGSATNRTRFDRDAFSQPSANLSFAERGGFFLGNGLFRRNWVTAPSSTRSADGLGPLYNARACQRCHLKDGRGHPPSGPDDSRVSLLVRLSVPKHPPQASSHFETLPEPNYGNQLQDVATAGHRPEGWIAIRHHSRRVRLAGGTTAVLLQPRYRIENLGYGSLHPNVLMRPRVAPPMIGLGLLAAIDERVSVSVPVAMASCSPERMQPTGTPTASQGVPIGYGAAVANAPWLVALDGRQQSRRLTINRQPPCPGTLGSPPRCGPARGAIAQRRNGPVGKQLTETLKLASRRCRSTS